MTQKTAHNSRFMRAERPALGVRRPQLPALCALLGCALFAVGCGDQEQERNLEPAQVGLTPDVAPIFDDGEMQLFEVKRGFQFPILQPDGATMGGLNQQATEPYGRQPWITNEDVKVQLTWTLSNLDDAPHVVEILIDPWNEFGRYFPGFQLTNAEEQEFQPNSSGIDRYFELGGKGQGDASRRHGTFTFDDMNELAIDFSTVLAMIKNPPPLPSGVESDPEMMTDPLPVYANHCFNWQNRSYNDLLTKPYIPAVVAGLTGVDFGFRTQEKATIALDVAIEIVGAREDRVQKEGGSATLMQPTTEVITVGAAVP